MTQVCVIFPLLVLISVRLVYGFPSDNVMLIPQLEGRNVDPFLTHPSQVYMSQFQANRNKPQQVLNTNVMYRRQPQIPVTEKPNNQNLTFGELMEALNEVAQKTQHKEEEFQQLRAAESTARDENQVYPTLPRPTGYTRPNFAAPTTYHETAPHASQTPASSTQPKTSLLNFSSALTPSPPKSKFSGLIGLIFSLLSGGSSGGQFSGLKDILLEGIVRPLLTSKGELKPLISKLSIPVIALVLINIEVLITVWWLWEECPEYVPQPAPSTPTYAKPTSSPPYNSNYNSYR
ncbi:hypothetical protein PYW08_016449 [Mythimna loreyi]|uniref:Uncharacterized protein n=1 Tax=Mythimna loreyi TaxID=667449 RepID=A0ACC2QXN7_9NEOP|nr:hypothetical protein PYW08_016449 [Mythimna loreyi]